MNIKDIAYHIKAIDNCLSREERSNSEEIIDALVGLCWDEEEASEIKSQLSEVDEIAYRNANERYGFTSYGKKEDWE